MKQLIDVADFAGITLHTGQLDQLQRYAEWLGTEAVASGGIGPGETGRIESRHLADSLLFATQFPHDAVEILDLGSGVGLPGIPLAIALPRARVRLIDRSGRRIDLARRAIRILDLENCEAVQAEIETLHIQSPVIVSRASLPPPQLAAVASRLLTPGGVAVVAGSWHEPPRFPGWETVEIPSDVLDQPVWLLIMRRE